jgi:lysophospholipase L1-like esterase
MDRQSDRARRVLGVMALLAAAATLRCANPNTPTTPPPPPPDPAAVEVTCPQPVTIKSLHGEPTIAVYGQATGTSGAPPVTVTCTPASGGMFPVGMSTVECKATDARQRTASCTFALTVTAPPRISATRFVAFGDSMTSGEIPALGLNPSTGGFLVDPNAAYPRRLEVALAGRYTDQTPSVRNQGQSGEQATEGRSRLSRMLAGTAFEVLLLMDGGNDLIEGDARKVGPAVGAIQFMVRDAKSRGLRVFLGSLPPQDPLACCPRRGSGAGLVNQYNSQLRSVAAAENVPFVDVNAAFAGDTTTLIDRDGLHPTAAGYQRIADTFFKSITETLELPPVMTFDPRGMAPAGFRARRR